MRKYRSAKHKKISNEQFFRSVELALQLQNFVKNLEFVQKLSSILAVEKILETTGCFVICPFCENLIS